jgi:HEAT repeat protein
MTFFCVNCFGELSGEGGRCPRCGATQNLDGRDYVAKLRNALAHPIAETRRRAIYLLGEKRMEEAVGQLIEIVDQENDPFVVEEAVAALGKIRGAMAMEALLRAARHKSFLVRARAIHSLVEAGGDWARAAKRIVRSDSSALVRDAVQTKSMKDRQA